MMSMTVIKTRSRLDELLGLEYYVSRTPPINGKIRKHPLDFKVFEVFKNGIVLINPDEIRFLYSKVRGLYSIYTLTKCNLPFNLIEIWIKSTFKSKNVGFSGIKDTRAFTSQFVSVASEYVFDKVGLIFSESRYLSLSLLGSSPRGIAIGDNLGNVFNILIRELILNVESLFKIIDQILKDMHKHGGLPNYFGYQRFGTIRPNTHIVGKYLLLKDFKSAVLELLTTVYPYESERSKRARLFLKETLDYKRALNLFPSSLRYERILIKHLAKNKGDYEGAILRLPLWLRRLFIEAYQAYLFNKILSRRLSMGLLVNDVIPGDVVFFYNSGTFKKIVKEFEIEQAKECIELGLASLQLPLIGSSFNLTEHFADEIILDILDEEGISLDCFKNPRPVVPSIKGTFRPTSYIPMIYEMQYHKSTLLLNFFLPRGSYATVFLREILKPEDPYLAGF